MKKQFILFLFLLPFVAVGAKTIHKVVNPTYVGINEGTMKIASVKTTEEATVLTFQYPGEGFYQFAPNIHLVDEQGKHYELIGQKGFSEDSLKNMKPTKKGRYELHFEPLPAKTRIFDFIEDFYSWTGTSYYGIRNEGTPFSVSNPLSHNEGENSFSDIDFKKDSVIITGHIYDYNPEICKFKCIELSDLHHPTFRIYHGSDIYNKNVAQIDENGDFRLSVQTYGPTWTYLRLSSDGREREGERFLPIMLYPNDQINMGIYISEGNRPQKVEYKSLKKKDFCKLMQSAPMILTQLEHGNDSIRYEQMTKESIEKSFKDFDELALYLSGKYGLNRIETELLRSQLSVVLAIQVNKISSRYLYQKHASSDSKTWENSDSPYFEIAFSNVRASNNLFLATPDWSRLLNRSYMVSIPQYNKLEHDFYQSIEDIETKGVKEFYNACIKFIREYRKMGNGDTIFEHAYLLCNTMNMPYTYMSGSPMNNEVLKIFLPDRFQHISKSRELFTHPSFVRLAGELLWEREKSLYLELEEFAEREEAQQNNK